MASRRPEASLAEAVEILPPLTVLGARKLYVPIKVSDISGQVPQYVKLYLCLSRYLSRSTFAIGFYYYWFGTLQIRIVVWISVTGSGFYFFYEIPMLPADVSTACRMAEGMTDTYSLNCLNSSSLKTSSSRLPCA